MFKGLVSTGGAALTPAPICELVDSIARPPERPAFAANQPWLPEQYILHNTQVAMLNALGINSSKGTIAVKVPRTARSCNHRSFECLCQCHGIAAGAASSGVSIGGSGFAGSGNIESRGLPVGPPIVICARSRSYCSTSSRSGELKWGCTVPANCRGLSMGPQSPHQAGRASEMRSERSRHGCLPSPATVTRSMSRCCLTPAPV